MKIVTNETELRRPCEPVRLSEMKDIVNKLPEIFRTMLENEGVGLSSTQIGIHKTFFVAWVKDSLKLFINPKITYYSPETNVSTEGCLSFPGVSAEIERSNEIVIESFNYGKKKIVRERYFDLDARIIQHEYDHLKGILCVLDKGVQKNKEDI